MLGVGEHSPGKGDHFYNIINKNFTFPRSKASMDEKFNRAWTPVLDSRRYATGLVHDYHENLASWQGKSQDEWRKQFAAMEILTLQGRDVPTDGRAIIVENTGHPHAALSKVGDVVRLTTPDEIKMFADYRGTMDRVWKDLVGETAKQFGWAGEPSAAAIYKAAGEVGSETREGRHLLRAAKIVAAIEYQHRDAYLPLMRDGDYFVRVKPERPNAEWTGEGFPPTVMFKLIDSMTPAERAIGGMRSGTPKLATDAIADIRKTFPEGEYDISHGYAFRNADVLRDLDIPAIDKLMMLVSNDARGQISDRLEHAGMTKEEARSAAQADYDKLVDTVLDRLYEERVSGFKRQRMGIAGYDPDFARSTGRYLNWLASHISGLHYRPQIEAGEAAMAEHPDPRSQAAYRDFTRRQEDYGDQLYGPLMRLRQGAFYYLLGGNVATTAKIMLHGPLRGVPILTTGLGAQGRMRAVGDYLAASKDVAKGLGIGRGGIQVDFDAPAFQKSLSPAERTMFANAEREGIVHQQTADELAAVRREGEEALTPRGRLTRRVLDIWGSNVSAADRMTRGAMLLAGYRTADRVGMDAINRVWDKDLNWRNAPEKTPEAFGRFLVDQAVGVWGDVNRMPVMRSQLGGMLGQMKLYEAGYMSNLHQMMTRMGPEGKVTASLMLGGLGMMGGLTALPFIGDAEKAAEWVYQMIEGIAPDFQADLKHALDALIGEGGGELVLHGARPGGIDWSGIGFGDIVGKNVQSPLDLAGAAVSTAVGGPYRAYKRADSGQGALAASQELMPNAVKHFMQALYPEISLYSASGASKAQPPSDADRLKTGLGFQPEAKAVHYEQVRAATQAKQSYEHGLTLAENRIANLQDRGEPTAQALTDATALLTKGMQAGIWTKAEVARFDADLRRKMAQRANPAMGSRTQQRFEAARAAQP